MSENAYTLSRYRWKNAKKLTRAQLCSTVIYATLYVQWTKPAYQPTVTVTTLGGFLYVCRSESLIKRNPVLQSPGFESGFFYRE